VDAWSWQLDRFFDDLVGVRGLSAHTAEAYARDLQKLVAAIGSRTTPEAAVLDDLRYAVASLPSSLSNKSVARTISAFRQFFRFLAKSGVRPDDPGKDLEAPRVERTLPTVPSQAEMARLLDGLSGTDRKSLRDRAMFELLYSCGLRVSELTSLDRDGLHFDRGLVRVTGKGDKERLVPMGVHAQTAILRWLEIRPQARSEAVFLNARAGRLSRVGVF
jgi:integrase/recombinase XerC